MCVSKEEMIVLVVFTICMIAPTIIEEIGTVLSNKQNNRIEKLEEEIKELKRK